MSSALTVVRSRTRNRVARVARGPFRTRLRAAQARSVLLAGGRRPGPPDFVGIGVQRAGTSWWHGILETHPRIDGLGWTAKELHFFDELWSHELTDADIRRYESHFLRRTGHLSGEWTPRYLSDPWAVPLLRRAAPDARLLVLLRDPVDRFRSGVGHARERLGGATPDLVVDAVARGYYAAQLRRLFQHVPREQVLVLQFERCRAEPQRLARHTFEFLGLDPVDVPAGARTNAGGARIQLPPAFEAQLVADYADDVAALADIVPDTVDLDLWPHFASRRG